jgi:hypothetical protein
LIEFEDYSLPPSGFSSPLKSDERVLERTIFFLGGSFAGAEVEEESCAGSAGLLSSLAGMGGFPNKPLAGMDVCPNKPLTGIERTRGESGALPGSGGAGGAVLPG